MKLDLKLPRIYNDYKFPTWNVLARECRQCRARVCLRVAAKQRDPRRTPSAAF